MKELNLRTREFVDVSSPVKPSVARKEIERVFGKIPMTVYADKIVLEVEVDESKLTSITSKL